MSRKLSALRITIKLQVIIAAIIAAVATILVGYWQFVLNKPSQLESTPTKPAIEYIGHILDESTQRPIPNAKVSFEFQGVPLVVYTDAEGVYRFTLNINQDKVNGRVRIEASGYDIYILNVEVDRDDPNIDDVRMRRR